MKVNILIVFVCKLARRPIRSSRIHKSKTSICIHLRTDQKNRETNQKNNWILINFLCNLIWWNLMKFNESWWNLVKFDEIQLNWLNRHRTPSCVKRNLGILNHDLLLERMQFTFLVDNVVLAITLFASNFGDDFCCILLIQQIDVWKKWYLFGCLVR